MRRRSKHSQKRIQNIIVVVGVVFIMLVIVFNHHIASVLSGVISLVQTPEEVLYQQLPRNILAARLEDAETELSRIRYQSILYTREVERNEELRTALGLVEASAYAHGSVLSRPPRTHYDTLLVSVDNTQSFKLFDEVHAFGIAIGVVQELRANTVLVSLYSSPGNILDVRVGQPSAIAVMEGLGGGAFVFELSKEVTLEPGDVVLSANTEEVVAVVQNIVDEPERTTVTVYASTPVTLADMRIVEFIRTVSTEE